jgi:hypothetical protein
MPEATATPARVEGARDRRSEAVVDALVEARRTIARLQATEVMLLAAAYDLGAERIAPSSGSGDPDRDIPLRSLAAQIGAASHTSDRTVGIRMSEAVAVRDRFPLTLAAQAAGEITQQHQRVIVEAGLHLDDRAERTAYENEVIAVARRETPGRTRPLARRLAERHSPHAFSERHERARRCRAVQVRDTDDGMAVLTALMPSTLAHAAHDRIATMGRAVQQAADASDTRSRAEIRADVLADLLLTGHSTAQITDESPAVTDTIRAHVQIVIPAESLVGGDHAAELIGGSVVDAATARVLAGTATGWDRLFLHPRDATVVAVDRYRPSDQQRRLLAARDGHCRFPGCRVPVHRCDVDHTLAAAHGGPTEINNLAHLCRRHHTLKHHSAWRVTQHLDGTLEWTSPTGRRHDDRPAHPLMFSSTCDPPPF